MKVNTPAEDQAEIDKVDVNFDIKEEEEETKVAVANEESKEGAANEESKEAASE